MFKSLAFVKACFVRFKKRNSRSGERGNKNSKGEAGFEKSFTTYPRKVLICCYDWTQILQVVVMCLFWLSLVFAFRSILSHLLH
jgi:hypothetical protein